MTSDLAAPSIYVSGYTQDDLGTGPGLARYDLLADGLVGERRARATAANPSFVIAGGGFLLAAEEVEQGSLAALDPLTLEVVGRVSTGGSSPCHVALIDGQVWVANYSSGDASVLPLAELVGAATAPPPVPRRLAHPGSGPVSGRQRESHAHQVTATVWGTALVSDLGADRVDEYALADGGYALIGSAQLPPGAGPRHVAIKDEFLLVAGELDGCLHVLQRTPRTAGGESFWRWLFKVALAETSQQDTSFPSHIELSSDGSKLYAAVRGPDTLVVLDVSGLSADSAGGTVPARPRVLREVPCGGQWPRHFALHTMVGHGTMLYVANQRSNNVAVFDLDENGLPALVPVQLVEFGSPTCIVVG